MSKVKLVPQVLMEMMALMELMELMELVERMERMEWMECTAVRKCGRKDRWTYIRNELSEESTPVSTYAVPRNEWHGWHGWNGWKGWNGLGRIGMEW